MTTTTTIKYKEKTYQVNLDSKDWFNNKSDKIIKLPTGELLRLKNSVKNLILEEVEEGWLEAKEVMINELKTSLLTSEHNKTKELTEVSNLVKLQFTPWEYPNLEESVMRFTKGNPNISIYSHTSRFNGIDCNLLPRTLLVHYPDSIHFVYSPYLECIGFHFENSDDYISSLEAYVNTKDKQLVTFKFVTENKKEESVLIDSSNNDSFEKEEGKQEHLISKWDMTTEMMNQNAHYFSGSTHKQTESKESIYPCNKNSTVKGSNSDSIVTNGGDNKPSVDKEVIKECVDFFKSVKPSYDG